MPDRALEAPLKLTTPRWIEHLIFTEIILRKMLGSQTLKRLQYNNGNLVTDSQVFFDPSRAGPRHT